MYLHAYMCIGQMSLTPKTDLRLPSEVPSA